MGAVASVVERAAGEGAGGMKSRWSVYCLST